MTISELHQVNYHVAMGLTSVAESKLEREMTTMAEEASANTWPKPGHRRLSCMWSRSGLALHARERRSCQITYDTMGGLRGNATISMCLGNLLQKTNGMTRRDRERTVHTYCRGGFAAGVTEGLNWRPPESACQRA